MWLTALLTPVLCECISLAAQVAISVLFLDSYCNCTAFVSDSILVPSSKLFYSACYFRSVPLNPKKASVSVVLNILYWRSRQCHVKQINFLWFCTNGPCLLLNTKISHVPWQSICLLFSASAENLVSHQVGEYCYFEYSQCSILLFFFLSWADTNLFSLNIDIQAIKRIINFKSFLHCKIVEITGANKISVST